MSLVLNLSKKEISSFKKTFRAAKRRSLKKKYNFDISLDDIIEQYKKQDGKCFYSGIKMNILKTTKTLHDPYKLTIDRKDPNVGYTKDNISLCLYCVNSFKQKMSGKELFLICKNIVECKI